MKKFIPLASPDIQPADIAAVTAVLETGMLVQGKNVAEFEYAISSYTQSRYAIATSNGTSTMHIALCLLGIGPGDEVIVPAFSYVATANVVELVGATPIFVDINLETFNIDLAQIETKITPKTKAIIPVHEFGLPCEISEIVELARKHNISVIEDAACALGATYNNQHVGTFGDFGSFSLHPRKAISSGEGGIITTNDSVFDKGCRTLRNHGVGEINGKPAFVAAGFNYRMTDFQAALVNSQFERFDTILAKKKLLVQQYQSEINNSKITLPSSPANRKHSWQTFHVLLDESLKRDDIIDALRAKGIGTNYGAQCIPAQHYYIKKYGLQAKTLFPNAWKAFTQGLALPLYEKLTPADISYIAEELNKLA